MSTANVNPCFIFNAPAEVANKGVYAAIFGMITDFAYTNSAGTSIPIGSNVYFNGSDYFEVPSSGVLPLVTLFQPSSQPSKVCSEMLSFNIQLTNAHITAGIIVISVGSMIQLLTNGSVAVPTSTTYPTDVFGLMEFTFNNNGLDIDISQVDQIGFPFTLNSDPPPGFPAQNGVGMPLNRNRFFCLFQNYPDFKKDAPGHCFLECCTRGNINGTQYRLVAPQDVLLSDANQGISSPLRNYFDDAIQEFFKHYTKEKPFKITLNSTSTTWSGYTIADYKPSWAPNTPYTVLQLKGHGGSDDKKVVNVYQPFFKDNMKNPKYPPAPNWLPSKSESPSQMVFGCDGVFASYQDPEAIDVNIKDIENPIVSALNRGIATSGVPTSWANFPIFTSATPTTGGSLKKNTYYYVMTSLDAEKNESTTSFEWKVDVDGETNNSVSLQWKPEPPGVMSSFKIYRGTIPGQENVLVAMIPNNVTPPPNSYTDNGTSQTSLTPPYRYYAPCSTSNLYAKFLHENISNNPTKGVSINSLVYGFPYDDQGGSSTNIGFPTMPNSVTITLSAWQ